MKKIKRKIYLDKIIKVMKNDYPLFKNLKLYGFYDQLSEDELKYIFSNIFEQPIRVLGVLYVIYDEYGYVIYSENSNGYWYKKEYDENRNVIYYEDSSGEWEKYQYDENNNLIYFEESYGFWEKREYDENGNRIYSETSKGDIQYYG